MWSFCLYYSRTSIIRNLDYPALQIAYFNYIHCNFGVQHLEYSVRLFRISTEGLHRAIVLRLSGWLLAQRNPDNRGSTVLWCNHMCGFTLMSDSVFLYLW